MSQTIAVTGGTGFVGAAVINALVARGDKVRALARNPQKLPQSQGIAAVKGALDDAPALEDLARGAHAFIHCAGLTHALRDAEFLDVNVGGARFAASAAARAGAKFVHISSMAARQPELSAYAASKRLSEDAIAEASRNNSWIALRLPAIYGPGDPATLPYFKMIKSGFAPEPAANPSPRASILYVGDAAAAVIAALDSAVHGKVYEIGDDAPEGHSWREIGEALAAAMQKKARPFPAPRIVLISCAAIGAGVSRLAGSAPMVTPGKVREFFHPDWVARDNLLSGATGWRPATPLKEGFAKTVRWYQENGLL